MNTTILPVMETQKTATTDHRKVIESNFSRIAERRGSVWLDSSYALNDRGHKSFIARNPAAELTLIGNEVKIVSSGQSVSRTGDVFDFLDQLELFTADGRFAAGYFNYESTLPFVGLESPEGATASFFVYDSHLTIDHRTDDSACSRPEIDDYVDLFAESDFEDKIERVNADVSSSAITRAEYLDKVRKILYHIHEGDIYQANLTTAFEVKSSLQPYEVFRRLRDFNPAPYGAYMNCGERRILCSSPERMFSRKGDLVTSGPIKGTIASGNSASECEKNLQLLLDSAKDKAELLMIVDLIRNDLGKVARPGTVSVTNLHKPEVYSSVIHLVGDVEARVRADTNFRDLCVALLPGGSITGAPKRRAIEILQQLETVPRSIYTGCIGYIYGDEADFNIAIRTIEHINNRYYVHAGGGIVADSDPDSEYQEMLLKAKNLFRALGVEQS